MKRFFNKFFSNPNKLINITCAILSVLVFVLGIFSVVASIFGQTYDGSSSQLLVIDSDITNDYYVTEGSTTSREKVFFTKEEDGTYGKTAFSEVIKFLEAEKKRVVTEGGVETEGNGTISVVAKVMGQSIKVVQNTTMVQDQDILGNVFYEELTKEVTSSGYGPNSSLHAYISNGVARYEATGSSKLNGSKVVGVYNGNIKEKPAKDFLANDSSFDVHPLGFSTDIEIIDLDNCKLEETFLGYNFTFNIKLNGNYFITDYQNRLGKAAEAVKGSTKMTKSQYVVSFNKYGQITSFDTHYAFNLKKMVAGEVGASSTGDLKTIVKYKTESYTVPKI